jgi:VIT1/CCC1 family predicted Fe2+/Mn2+ transporter
VNLKLSYIKGLSFGLTSGIITTLGMMVGLHAGTQSRLAVLGGILTIAVADAFSDALGIHISEESENKHTHGEVWEATVATFIAKFLFALTFLVPVLLLDLVTAIWVSIAWGMLCLGLISYWMARDQKVAPLGIISEHIGVGLFVVFITHYLGECIARVFGQM